MQEEKEILTPEVGPAALQRVSSAGAEVESRPLQLPKINPNQSYPLRLCHTKPSCSVV